jgi:uncharacterized protein YjbI with pentapeptide repeats
LRDTILRGTDFGYAELLGANLRGATFDENTNFQKRNHLSRRLLGGRSNLDKETESA